MHSVHISVCLVLLLAIASVDPQKRVTIYLTGPVRVNNRSTSGSSQEGHKVPTADQCSGEDGFCVATGDRCNGTFKLLHNSCNDHCICCVPDNQAVTHSCQDDEFHCGDGTCVNNSWKCDNEEDCLDGSDERGCSMTDITTVVPVKVAPDECYNMDQVPCSEFPEGENFPHPTRCNKFFKCVGGRVEVKTCLSGKLYNHLTGWCERNMNIGDCMCPLKSAIIEDPLPSTVPGACRPKKKCRKSDGTCRPNGCLPGELPIPKACRPKTCTCCTPGVRSAGPELLFNFNEMIVNPNEKIQLDCGIKGEYRYCVWEKDTDIYQVADVYENVYSGMSSPENKEGNQCGIVVDQATIEDHGIWTCKIYISGTSLEGSKDVVITRRSVDTETAVRNFSPEVNIRMPKLAWIAGQVYRMVIPENTFIDFEDGNTRDLKLIFKNSDGYNVGIYSWIQLDTNNQEIYALPLEENIGHWIFYLEAVDSEGKNKIETIIIHVQQAREARNFNHRITATFNLDKRASFELIYQLDWQVKAVEKIAALYGDETTDNIYVSDLLNYPYHQLSWTNVSLVDPLSQSCPENELKDIMQVLVIDNVDMEPTSKAKKVFEPEFVLNGVDVDYLGNCENYVEGCPEGFFMLNGSRQCFKFFHDKPRPWEEAKNKCVSEGLQLGEPTDAVAASLRRKLTLTYGDSSTWLGARGDGSSIRWERNGTAISFWDPLWVGGYPGSLVTTRHCLMLLVDKMKLRKNPGKPYGAWDCSSLRYPLCELV